jgi:hypothetical protein
VDDAKGMKVNLSDTASLNSDLTAGTIYKMTFTAYVSTGIATSKIYGGTGAIGYIDVASITTTATSHTVIWAADHASNDVFYPFYNMSSGQVAFIKDISFKPLNGNPGALK